MNARAGRKERYRRTWAVDATTARDGTTWWAIVDETGTTVHTGSAATRFVPGTDSTRSEAKAILDAAATIPEGDRLLTDALQVVRSARDHRARHQIGGLAGEIADMLREHRVRLSWASRRNRLVRAAHRAARQRARESSRSDEHE